MSPSAGEPGATFGQPGGQLDPEDGRQVLAPIQRLYGPLQSFFDKGWQPSEIEVVT